MNTHKYKVYKIISDFIDEDSKLRSEYEDILDKVEIFKEILSNYIIFKIYNDKSWLRNKVYIDDFTFIGENIEVNYTIYDFDDIVQKDQNHMYINLNDFMTYIHNSFYTHLI